MPNGPDGGDAPAADDLTPDTPNTGAGALPDNDPEGESTNPAEVREILRGAGMKVADEPDDEEEGADPDAEEEDPEADPDPAADPEADPAADPDVGPAADPAAEEEDEGDAAVDPPLNTADPEKYSFTVKDANGITFKIQAGDDLEEVLTDFEPTGYGQLIKIGQQLTAMDAQKDADAQDEAKQTEATEKAQRVSELRAGWDGEVKDLTAQKRIPEGTEGEARISEVYQFMGTENDARIKAGKPTIGSFEDALDKLEAKEARDAKAKAAKDAKTGARKNGGLVGGSSAPASSGPKPYRSGSAKNANAALKGLGLL